MYNKVLSVILVILIIAITGTLAFLGYGYYRKHKINKDAEVFLDGELEEYYVQLDEAKQEHDFDEEDPDNNNENGNGNGNSYYGGIDTNSLVYKGYKVAGKLEMPTINIRYPILDTITDANAIEISVGILYGPGINQIGNTTIIGHNYNNGLFFGKNKNLQIGQKIYITDMQGQKLEYTIFDKYYTPESDTSYITRQTDGKIEVSLVTCDTTGANRLVVCARVE